VSGLCGRGLTAEEVTQDSFLDGELVGVGAVGEALQGFDVIVEAEHVLRSCANVVAGLPGRGKVCELLGQVGGVVVEVPGWSAPICCMIRWG
jgi:hypothetical protein